MCQRPDEIGFIDNGSSNKKLDSICMGKYVCSSHFKDRYIKQHIEYYKGKRHKCSYCNEVDAVPLKYVLDFIGEQISRYFNSLEKEDLYLKSAVIDKNDEDENIPGFKSVGPYITGADAKEYESDDFMLEVGLASICDELYNDIKNYLENYFGGYHTDFIQKDSCLPRYDKGLISEWHSFEKIVKYDDSEEDDIMSLYDELFSKIEKNIRDAHLDGRNLNGDDSGFEGGKMYRCRCLSGSEHVNAIDDIVSPPADKAKDNRMSEEGVSCFYGANTLDVSKAEVGADLSDNNHYAIGLLRLKANDSVNIIDLTAAPKRLSYFADYDYLAMKFLNRFSDEVSKPNNGTHKDYLPTQYVTSELRRRFPNLTGIIYNSSKVVKSAKMGKNVILFYDTQDCLRELALEYLKEVLPGNVEKVIINNTITQ